MANLQFEAVSTPFRTVDPEDGDYSDLAPFAEIIGAARVAAIGENAHGVRELFQFKHRLFRYLVAEKGFTAFVLESGFPESLAVNDWVLGGPGRIEDIAPGGISWGFDVEELREQFRWMRKWNAKHDRKVRFYGMDVTGSGTQTLPGIKACLQRIAPQPGDADLVKLAELGARFEVAHVYADMPQEHRERLWTGVSGLLARAEAAGDEVAVRCALAIDPVRIMLDTPDPLVNPRDELMADTVRWILEREDRVMISAANGHVVRGDLFGTPRLGKFLEPVLGSDMVVIGSTYASGKVVRIDNLLDWNNWDIKLPELPAPPQDTLDAAMDAVPADLHVVDLRKLSDATLAPYPLMFLHHDSVPYDARGFDALFHVRHVSTAAGSFEEMKREVALGSAMHRARAAAKAGS
jgi:erythromycin esterase